MIRFNLSIRELFIIFIIFLCYCVFVFYNTRNIKENFAVKGDECVKIGTDKAKCNNNANCMVVPEQIEITVSSVIVDNKYIPLEKQYLDKLEIGDKIDVSLLHKDAFINVANNTVITNINKTDKNTIKLSPEIDKLPTPGHLTQVTVTKGKEQIYFNLDKIENELIYISGNITKLGVNDKFTINKIVYKITEINIANSITLSNKINVPATTLTFIRDICKKKCSLYSKADCTSAQGNIYCKWDPSTNKCNKKCDTYPKAECPPGRCKVDSYDKCVPNTDTDTDNSRKECNSFETDKNCKLADHCNWNEGLNPPKCETNCGSYNYESCNVNSVCKWDDTRSSCRFDCSKAYASEATCDVVDARCQWNNDNNTCQNRSAFHCAQHGNQWECNYNEQCEWNAKPTDGRAPRCDYKNCENIEDKDKCDKMDERCKWETDKCKTNTDYSDGVIDDTRLDYFEKQKANFKIHQIFCDRLKRLDKPNKNNLIFKRFTKDFIDNKKKHVKILEDKIQHLHKRQHEITTYNYNINKIREHDQASKQVAAIKKGIENIKNKNKIKINLE